LTPRIQYGPDVSEGLIAEALYPYPEGVVVATMGGYERPGPDQWKLPMERNLTPSQVALAWLLPRSQVILRIPGTSNVTHVVENVAAANVRLTEDEVNAVNQILLLDRSRRALTARGGRETSAVRRSPSRLVRSSYPHC
jgi:aryl-alcohol dehydrogenase-like predicted oxidoreductase